MHRTGEGCTSATWVCLCLREPDLIIQVVPMSRADALPLPQAKVAKFLQLKYEKDQHINTTLLSSSAFANPHIYAKLVRVSRV